MTMGPRFADNDDSFSEIVEIVYDQLDTGRRLPDWPFKMLAGFAAIYEYDRILGGDFGSVIATLVSAYGDEVVTVVGFEPLPSYYRDAYNFYPGFQVPGRSVGDGYGEGLRYEPGDDPTGAMAYTLNIIAIVGASGAWSVWGQRDWEIGLLLTRDPSGAWLSDDVPRYGHDVDLASIRSPVGWGIPLSDAQLQTFSKNLRERGSGPGRG
ncbi:MAG: hypothetical protein ACRDOI_19990 [Trebonia sp.]